MIGLLSSEYQNLSRRDVSATNQASRVFLLEIYWHISDGDFSPKIKSSLKSAKVAESL